MQYCVLMGYTRAITKGDEYCLTAPSQQIALCYTEYSPRVIFTNFFIGQQLSDNPMKNYKNIICTSLLHIETVKFERNWSGSC